MLTEEILKLIENISPHAKDYVIKAFKNRNLHILYSMFTEQNKGVFMKA